MPVLSTLIKDYQSDSANSDGGGISTNVMPEAQLALDASAGDMSITLNDATDFTPGLDVVLFDELNPTIFEEKTIDTVVSEVVTFTEKLQNNFAAGTDIGQMNCLFANITQSQANGTSTMYRKLFRENKNSSDSVIGPRSYLPYQPDEGCFSIGFGLNSADDADGNQGNMVPLASNEKIKVKSSAADTRVLTLVGLDTSGAFLTEDVTLNGATYVVSTNTFSKLFMAYIGSLATKTVTIVGNTSATTFGTIGSNKKTSFLWFGKRVVSGVIVAAEGGDIPGGTEISEIDNSNSILYSDISFQDSIPIWIRYMNLPAQAYEMTVFVLRTLGAATH